MLLEGFQTFGPVTYTTIHPGIMLHSAAVRISTCYQYLQSSKLTGMRLVLGCAAVFMAVLTGYRFHIRKLNKLLDGTPEDQLKALKSGVTQQQIDLNWRFIGY
jgi:hypothetical protein